MTYKRKSIFFDLFPIIMLLIMSLLFPLTFILNMSIFYSVIIAIPSLVSFLALIKYCKFRNLYDSIELSNTNIRVLKNNNCIYSFPIPEAIKKIEVVETNDRLAIHLSHQNNVFKFATWSFADKDILNKDITEILKHHNLTKHSS